MRKPINITEHASSRAIKYGISRNEIIECLSSPDEVVEGYKGRKIAHKFKNNHLLRVIYEEDDVITVVTVYLARRKRYERRV